jgi:hypothetical protein
MRGMQMNQSHLKILVLIFKSCRFAPPCLRKARETAVDPPNTNVTNVNTVHTTSPTHQTTPWEGSKLTSAHPTNKNPNTIAAPTTIFAHSKL